MSLSSSSMERHMITLISFSLLTLVSVIGVVTADLKGGIIQRSGLGFVDEIGNPFTVQGANVYWLMVQGASPATRNFVDAVYSDAQTLGLNVIRTWAFNDGTTDGALQTAPGVYDESVLQALDYAVAEAAKYNIRLIMSLVNNFDNYGGRSQYAQWAVDEGEVMPNNDFFYNNTLTRTWYKNHVKTVLSRVNTITRVAYQDDPAIFGWELINEAQCQSDVSGNTLAAWVEEMASYVKSIDGKHLLEIGLEGYYGSSTPDRISVNPLSYNGYGTDFIRLNQIANIDFASVHSYPDTWLPDKSDDEKLSFLQTWMNQHIKDATDTLNMPVMFCEFGKSDQVSGYQPQMREQLYSTVYNSVYSSITKGGAGAGTLFWQLLPKGMESWDDGFGVFASDSSLVSTINSQSSRLTKFMASKSTKSRRRLLF
ncbi:hypothetical protein R1flu_028252 [Riccia fluitans]|uniref:mannan endo-1,4-beta-mannosidase n=1 Tax=Riccia fluitans TaxID=41844 RepID=A0ABD1XL59_9MARC